MWSAFLIFFLPTLSRATFFLYGGRELADFSTERGVSQSCMSALNSTLDCAEGFLERTFQLESYLWTTANMSTGCTASCASDLEQWVANVQTACSAESMQNEGMLIAPATLPLMYNHQYTLACLPGGDSGWCWVDSQDWVGSDIKRYPSNLCETGHDTWDADICFEEGFDQMVIESDDVRLTSLYDSSMVCSDCFLKIFHQRLLSPLLRAGEYTSYLLEQHDDLQSVCSTSMPLQTATSSLYLGTMPLATATPTASGSATITGAAATTTCLGTVISPPASPMDCHMLSEAYNVTTGDLTVLTGDWSCFVTESICAPPPCDIKKIGWLETCETLRASISTDSNNVTLVQFSDWNPRIIGTCDDVRGDQYICTNPPGGVYVPPAPVYAPTAASEYYSTATPALPTSTGTTESCGKYYNVASGDTCQGIVLQNGITLALFYELNTQVYENCTNLWLDYAYCVAPVTESPISLDGKCGPDNGYATCVGSEFGECCSYYGYCGATEEYCAVGNCYSGACEGSGEGITQDGSCGPDHNNWLCGGSWGTCCSIYGYCGSSSDYCSAGNCYSGACETDNGGPSLDGSCGPNFAGNKTCTGTQFGACCSLYGYCGDSADYCGAGNCYSGACLSA